MPEILTVKEAAQYLKLSVVTIRRLIKKGEIPHFKIGDAVRIDKQDLDKYLESKKKIGQ